MDLVNYRGEFPVRERFVYLNHASTGPLPRRSAQAMQEFAQDQMLSGGMNYAAWIEGVKGLRQAASRLTGSKPGEIAVTKNTSEGLSFIANGIRWRKGDAAVGVRQDFPANYFPWSRLAARGVETRWVELREGRLELEDLDRACQGARLLAVSFVHYLSGFRLDLEAVGEICRRRGCLYVVDAVQGLGPFTVDVNRAGIHALSASAHKWLLGPEGVGFLYAAQEIQDEIEPMEFGWTNVTGFPEYSHEERLRPDAGRFECGTLNTIGCFGMRASLELFLEAGVERVGARVLDLAQRVAEGAAERGYELAAQRCGATGSGIISVRKHGVDARAVAARLAQHGISVAPRHGWLRASPHFYNSEDEIDAFLAQLP